MPPVVVLQDRQIGGAGVDVVLRIEQVAAARGTPFAAHLEHILTGGMLHHLHQAQRVRTAHRIRVEARFGLHDSGISDSSTPYFSDALRTIGRYLCARLSRWFGTSWMVTE